ncbi:MAG: CPBP family intramembrane glutamic endopeptidase [Thiobacillus sp.]
MQRNKYQSLVERILTLTTTSQQHPSLLGVGTPFATRWGLALLLGPLVYMLYRAMQPLALALFGLPIAMTYPIPVFYGPALVFLGTMFVAHKRFCFPDMLFVGTFSRKSAVSGIIAVTIVYLATYVAAHLLGQPREPAIVSLYQFKTDTQVVVLIVSLLLLPPIVEELAFRHFILSTLPFNASAGISWVAVTATALFFVYAHGYIYLTTKLLIFAVAMIFGFARVRSGGLLLPIGLHAYAIAFGLVCNQIATYLEN